MKIYNNVLELVGNTPLVRLNVLSRGLRCQVVVKCEQFNPGGSVKDRIAINMLEKAIARGELKPGGTIVEGTSGNTGAGLALFAAIKGFKCIFTMQDKQSRAKVDYLKALGAEVVVAPTAVEPEDPRSYYSVAKRLRDETPNCYYPNQYDNQDNPETHYHSTGPEIWEDTDGKITHLVVGLGTGGTISGTARYLKEKNPKLQVIGVDPYGSIYHEYHKTGKMGDAYTYKIEGVGEDIIPEAIDMSLIDDVVQCSDRDAFITARRLAKEEALFVGGSAGMAVYGALRVAADLGPDDLMVVILPDHGDRYLQDRFFSDEWMRDNQFLAPSRELTAGDVVAEKNPAARQLRGVSPNRSLQELLDLFSAHDLSQMPVMEKDQVIGAVYEDNIMELALSGRDLTKMKVRDVMSEPPPIVKSDTPAAAIMTHFKQGQTAVIVGADGEFDIITRYDLMQAIASRDLL